MQDYNENNYYAEQYSSSAQQEPISTYTAKTFGWMFLGLLVTFAIAVGGYVTGALVYIFYIPYFPYVLLIAEVAVVWILSARIQKMSVTTARILFFVYAILNGIVFSTYFFLFQMSSLIIVFGATALYFGAMAAYGYLAKADLSNLRPILIGGALFLCAFWILSMFINLSQFERIISLIGIVIFMAFTAYDTQKIKAYHAAYAGNVEMAKKASIFSALNLYLDFVNLFLYLLRFVGKRK